MFWLIYFFDISIGKWLFRCNFLCITSSNIYVPKSTMSVLDPLKGPSSASMTCLTNFKFNPNYVNISRPKIILYLPLAESSKCHFHVTAFVVLSASGVKSTLFLRLLLILPACVCHCITAYFQRKSFSTSLPIKVHGNTPTVQ